MAGEWNRLLLALGLREKSEHENVIDRFYAEGGNELRLAYPLGPESLVFDLGGYLGEWTDHIFRRYQCHVFVFEPAEEFFFKIKDRFAAIDKIRVFPCGLAAFTGQAQLNLRQDGSSIFPSRGVRRESIDLVKASDFFAEHDIRSVAVMKINIEGAEYDLLDHMIASGLISRITNLQVQFHSFVPNAVQLRDDLHARLAATHRLTYCFPFVWENWQIKGS